MRLIDAGPRSPAPPLAADAGLAALDDFLAAAVAASDPDPVLVDLARLLADLTGARAVGLELPPWDDEASGADRWVRHGTLGPGAGTSRTIRLPVDRDARLTVWAEESWAADPDEHAPLADLTVAAGVLVVENLVRRIERRHRDRWIESVADIARQLVAPASAVEALQAVSDAARMTCGADVAWVMTSAPDDTFVHNAMSGFTAEQRAYAERQDLAASLSADVVRSGETRRLAGDERDLVRAKGDAWPGIGLALLTPAVFAASVEGMLGLAWGPDRAGDFLGVDQALVDSLSSLAAVAIRVARIQETSRRLEALEAWDQIARDLHDTAVQRLFAVELMLASGRSGLAPEDADTVDAALALLDSTIAHIRGAIAGLAHLRPAPTPTPDPAG